MSVQKCWELAEGWYRGRLERDWLGPDTPITQALFDAHGLRGEFWDVVSGG